MGKRTLILTFVILLDVAFGVFNKEPILFSDVYAQTFKDFSVESFQVTLSPYKGTDGYLLDTDFKIARNPLTNTTIGFKINLTNDNPLLEKAMLVSANAKWLPYWKLFGMDMGFNLTARGGVLNIDTETEPVDPPYPSQTLGGEEVGFSIARNLGKLSLLGGISQYTTYTKYDSTSNIDNKGGRADFGTKLNLTPFLLGAKWSGKRVDYNPDKYFFLDTMQENQYTLHFSYVKERFDVGLFHTICDREGIEFTQNKLLTGMGIGSYGWIFKGLLIQDITGDLDSMTFSIGKNYKDICCVEAYYTCNENISQTLYDNTIGFNFSYSLGRKRLPSSHPDSFKYCMPYDNHPFSLPPDYQTFEESAENLDSLSKVVRYTKAHIDYIDQEVVDRTPQEVFRARGGDCDEQVFFQHYILNKHNFGDVYEIGFLSPNMCHAFSYGKDKRTGEEYIWEYGRVFKLKFKEGEKLSLKEKVASILSSRSYTKDWEWFVTYGPELNYEDYYDNEVIAAEGFRTAPEGFTSGEGSVGIIPESGIQLFIGEEFEK